MREKRRNSRSGLLSRPLIRGILAIIVAVVVFFAIYQAHAEEQPDVPDAKQLAETSSPPQPPKWLLCYSEESCDVLYRKMHEAEMARLDEREASLDAREQELDARLEQNKLLGSHLGGQITLANQAIACMQHAADSMKACADKLRSDIAEEE